MYKYKNLCETNDPYNFKEKIEDKYLNLESIKKHIDLGVDIIGRNENYKPVKIDNNFPEYILRNLEKLNEWIIKKD